jgi:hypothetical protein
MNLVYGGGGEQKDGYVSSGMYDILYGGGKKHGELADNDSPSNEPTTFVSAAGPTEANAEGGVVFARSNTTNTTLSNTPAKIVPKQYHG